MSAFLLYDLKVAALLTVFYVFYRLLLERETFYRLNRMVLLLTSFLSIVLPLCVVTLHKEVVLEVGSGGMIPNMQDVGTLSEENVAAAEWYANATLWEAVLTVIFAAGFLFCLTRTLFGISKIHKLISNSETHELEDGIRVAVTDAPVAPFSWMNTVIVGRDDYLRSSSSDKEGWQTVLAHERGHILNRHSWDVVFTEILTALQWFNPVVWLLKQELRAVHEYEADANVLSTGCDTSQYMQLLMHKAMGIQACALANGITSSMIKKRVTRMIMKKSSKTKGLRALYIVPVVALSLAATAKTIIDYKYVENGQSILTVQEKIISDTTFYGPNGQRRIPVYGERQEIRASERYIIIDGKPATYEQLRALDRENIDHMEVLGEESGRKLYGDKGANGVLIVSTFKDKGTDSKLMPDDDDPVFNTVEQYPEFEGGTSALMQYLSREIRYPKVAAEHGIQGRVIIKFIVEKDGSVSNPHVLSVSSKSVNELNEVVVTSYKPEMSAEERTHAENEHAAYQAMVDEAVRFVKTMPHWKPGKQNGQSVRVYFTLPITFRLQ